MVLKEQNTRIMVINNSFSSNNEDVVTSEEEIQPCAGKLLVALFVTIVALG